MAVAPFVLGSGVAAFWLDDPRWGVLFAWFALVGWSTMIVHGMLTRIVPFLVWFHRFSQHVGKPGVPNLRQILPDSRARVGLVLHMLSLVLGVVAIVLRSEWLTMAAGVALAATGVSLFTALIRAVRMPAFVAVQYVSESQSTTS
jgi:hypothetical protein